LTKTLPKALIAPLDTAPALAPDGLTLLPVALPPPPPPQAVKTAAATAAASRRWGAFTFIGGS
jgi:hypothetical protein